MAPAPIVRGLPLIEPLAPGVTVTVMVLDAVVELPHWSITLTFAVHVLLLFFGTPVIVQLVAGVVQLVGVERLRRSRQEPVVGMAGQD